MMKCDSYDPMKYIFNIEIYTIFFVSFLSAVYFADRITEVKTNIYVTSFGPVSDTDMVRADMKCAFFLHQHPFDQPRGDS